MGHFDRPERPATTELPERLRRLDHELTTRAKDFDHVYAVRKNAFENYRIKVSVMRIPAAKGSDQFAATCSVGGKVHRSNHSLPSRAFTKLVEQLQWTASKLMVDKNMSKSVA